jgi:hypothetical protein
MVEVNGPKYTVTHDDRQLALQEQLDVIFADLIDQYAIAGYGTVETIDAMRDVLWNRRKLYAEDQDPAEDPDVGPDPDNGGPPDP